MEVAWANGMGPPPAAAAAAATRSWLSPTTAIRLPSEVRAYAMVIPSAAWTPPTMGVGGGGGAWATPRGARSAVANAAATRARVIRWAMERPGPWGVLDVAGIGSWSPGWQWGQVGLQDAHRVQDGPPQPDGPRHHEGIGPERHQGKLGKSAREQAAVRVAPPRHDGAQPRQRREVQDAQREARAWAELEPQATHRHATGAAHKSGSSTPRPIGRPEASGWVRRFPAACTARAGA